VAYPYPRKCHVRTAKRQPEGEFWLAGVTIPNVPIMAKQLKAGRLAPVRQSKWQRASSPEKETVGKFERAEGRDGRENEIQMDWRKDCAGDACICVAEG
jgi:hypothetical protein